MRILIMTVAALSLAGCAHSQKENPALAEFPGAQGQIENFYNDNATEDDWSCPEVQMNTSTRARWSAKPITGPHGGDLLHVLRREPGSWRLTCARASTPASSRPQLVGWLEPRLDVRPAAAVLSSDDRVRPGRPWRHGRHRDRGLRRRRRDCGRAGGCDRSRARRRCGGDRRVRAAGPARRRRQPLPHRAAHRLRADERRHLRHRDRLGRDRRHHDGDPVRGAACRHQPHRGGRGLPRRRGQAPWSTMPSI